MDLNLDINIANRYSNKSQIARVLTENWVRYNGYCPNCGNELSEFENNRPVADFLCENCREEFELKSKKSFKVSKKIVDGAYSKMIERIREENNPNFFFLTYDMTKLQVTNFVIIPKFFFLPNIIEKRKPLSSSARRAGWVGCNINIADIPENGRLYYVKQSQIIPQNQIIEDWKKVSFIKKRKGESKGWIIDIMKCIDNIPNIDFTLADVYKFEDILREKYPENHFIKDKIRQQLQILRDRGIIEFVSRGKYKKVVK